MSILPKLACSLGRRDEIPNKELAMELVAANDKFATKELLENLQNKDKNIQRDCLSTICEIAKIQPEFVKEYISRLVGLLEHKDNQMVWRAMIALNEVANENLDAIYNALPKISNAADNGSVITHYNCVGILTKLCREKKYKADAFTLLNERILRAPINQMPTYAELAEAVVPDDQIAFLVSTIYIRFSEFEGRKKQRLESVLKKLKAKSVK